MLLHQCRAKHHQERVKPAFGWLTTDRKSEVAVIPNSTMGMKPLLRMGPLPRSFAVDAHGCIMVRIRLDPPHTRLPRGTPPAMASSPQIVRC